MPTLDSSLAALIGAIVGAVVSLIGAVLNNYFHYQNNKANIRAKRAEITLIKRLDAYNAVSSAMSKFTTNLGNVGLAMAQKRSEDEIDREFSNFYQSLDELHETYNKNRVFFRREVDKSIGQIIEQIHSHTNFLSRRDFYAFETPSTLRACVTYGLDSLAEEIQLYIDEK